LALFIEDSLNGRLLHVHWLCTFYYWRLCTLIIFAICFQHNSHGKFGVLCPIVVTFGLYSPIEQQQIVCVPNGEGFFPLFWYKFINCHPPWFTWPIFLWSPCTCW
jgi:hypothetical protein